MLASWWAAIRALSPRTILAAGFAVLLIYAFPGYMSSDSVQQLDEGRTLVFTDGHPPLMAAIWGLLDAMISGPILMLLLQGATFLVGLFILLRRTLSPRAAAVAAVALMVFPPILTPMAVIWKDSQMAGFLVLGLAALLSERRAYRIAGLALVSAACAFRYNGFAAAVPLVGLLFVWRPGLRWWKRYAISGVAAIVVVGTAFGVGRALTVEHRVVAPWFADIVGVLAYTHDRTDDDLRDVLRGTPLRVTTNIQATARALYSPRNSYVLSHGDGRMFSAPKTQAQRDALDRAWKEIVASDWHAYLAHRLAAYRELLGLSDSELWSPVYNGFVEAPDQVDWIDHAATWSPCQLYMFRALAWFAYDTPLFQPYVWALIAIALLVLCCRDRLTFALLTSGLLYELSFFPAAGTPDFRYSHWMIVCTSLAIVLLVVQRARAGRSA